MSERNRYIGDPDDFIITPPGEAPPPVLDVGADLPTEPDRDGTPPEVDP